MGRFERKLLALLLLVVAAPIGVAAWLGAQLFEKTLEAGLNPGVTAALDDAVQMHGEWVRSERARQVAEARVLAKGQALAEAAAADAAEPGGDRPRLRALLSERAAVPRVLEIELVPDDSGAPPPPPRLVIRGAARDSGTSWRERTETVPLRGVEGYATLRYTYGLEAAFAARMERLGEDVIRPYNALSIEADAVARVFSRTLLAALIGALLVAALVALTLGRRLTRRIAELQAAMQRVAEGDLSVQVVPRGRDEVSALAEGFNQMTARLAESRARVQYLTQVSAWQDIARRLAHEIKNPLTPILLAVQQAERTGEGADARTRRALETAREIVEEEVATLQRLVENFSQFARLPEVSPARFDLVSLAHDVVEAHASLGDLRVVESGEVPVCADRGLLRQALTNLVRNALDAAAQAADGPRVEIQVVRRDGGARLSVQDNGPGVGPDDVERIFEPYVTGKATGTGLGLAIVKKIVLDHGGDIRVEPGAEGGARFVIDLPPTG